MIPTYESCCLNWDADKNYKYLMFEKLNLIYNFFFIFLKYIYFFSEWSNNNKLNNLIANILEIQSKKIYLKNHLLKSTN